MKKYLFSLAGLLMMSSVQAAAFTDGKEYLSLDSTVGDAPAVLEFFSFWCPSCYQYDEKMNVGENVKKRLPEGKTLTKYHVDFLGPLGADMTQAWSVAILLNVENKVKPLLFEAVQKKQNIRSTADIRKVFIEAGVSATEYDAALGSFAVTSLTAKQRKLAEAFQLQDVPAMYISGKYQINPKGLNDADVNTFVQHYADTVRYLTERE